MAEEHPRVAFERGTDGPKVIVAGVDDSESSWRAAAFAAGLARRQGALLALVYVQPLSGMATTAGLTAAMVQTGSEVAEDILAQVRGTAERMAEVFPIRWAFHTFFGDPSAGLAQAADDLKADVVVVGASERAGHRIVGSVAVRLVKSARWPVTVVP